VSATVGRHDDAVRVSRFMICVTLAFVTNPSQNLRPVRHESVVEVAIAMRNRKMP
jgi:hypothetical protein